MYTGLTNNKPRQSTTGHWAYIQSMMYNYIVHINVGEVYPMHNSNKTII